MPVSVNHAWRWSDTTAGQKNFLHQGASCPSQNDFIQKTIFFRNKLGSRRSSAPQLVGCNAELQWCLQWCCMYPMAGMRKGLWAFIKKASPHAEWTHCYTQKGTGIKAHFLWIKWGYDWHFGCSQFFKYQTTNKCLLCYQRGDGS